MPFLLQDNWPLQVPKIDQMKNIQDVKTELAQLADAKKAAVLPKFFQVYPGGYGEGDKFIGVSVPNQRMVAKNYFKDLTVQKIEMLLNEPIHEHRLAALFMLVLKYQKSKDEQMKAEIVSTYIANLNHVNNWDLVDSSAHLILGQHLLNRERSIIYEFAKSSSIWVQRVAVISTYQFIRKGQFDDTLRVSEMLLNHKQDLIHKAVGWMLREVGNRNFQIEFEFLANHYKKMPRTMLRYAIEKFPEELRQKFIKGLI